jgi:hypothetical protein
MQSHAASDAYKAHEAEQKAKKAAPEKKVTRSQAKEFSEAQVAGGSMADQLMDAYKRDPDMAEMLAEDPKKAEELRDALAEKAGSGASKMAMAEYATELIEKMYAMPTVVGSSIEDEGKKAA